MTNPNRAPAYLSAAEAAARLGVSRSSLYAYVSRGLLGSEPDPRDPRASRYLASEVERLLERRQIRRHPESAAGKALDWGAPVLESALTLIDGGRFYYRGRDVLSLADTCSFEDVVQLLWGEAGRASRAAPALHPEARALLPAPASLPVMERLQAVLPLAAAGDASAFDLRPASVAATGWRILHLMVDAAVQAPAAATAAGGAAPLEVPTSERLASGWGAAGRDAARLIDLALVLCADHELNTSAFAVRVVASALSTPYDAVAAGLAALRGPRHGGHTSRVEGLLDEAGEPERLFQTVADRMRRGDAVPGFGHPLYPEGDPRAARILAEIAARGAYAPAARFASECTRAGRDLLGHPPTLDLGLVLLRRALELPRGAALTLFAVGRTAGWVAHAMEQYAHGQLIRPRATYRGPPPRAAR